MKDMLITPDFITTHCIHASKYYIVSINMHDYVKKCFSFQQKQIQGQSKCLFGTGSLILNNRGNSSPNWPSYGCGIKLAKAILVFSLHGTQFLPN